LIEMTPSNGSVDQSENEIRSEFVIGCVDYAIGIYL